MNQFCVLACMFMVFMAFLPNNPWYVTAMDWASAVGISLIAINSAIKSACESEHDDPPQDSI